MRIQGEHLNIGTNGEIKGLFSLDINKLKGGDLWDKISLVMSSYYTLHPNEMRESILENTRIRETRSDEYGGAKNNKDNKRWMMNIPIALMFKLEEVEPKLFSDRKLLHKFIKKYKGLAICKKV